MEAGLGMGMGMGMGFPGAAVEIDAWSRLAFAVEYASSPFGAC